jgi:hypothetical protein
MNYPPYAGNEFFSAFAELMLETGAVNRGDILDSRTLDRALKTYIINVIEEHNYKTGGTFDA